MNTKDLNNKVCWITGASSGIGASLAIELSKLGAKLILSSRNYTNLEKIKSRCTDPDKIIIKQLDLENIDELPNIAEQVWNSSEGIDFVFLNAGFAVRDMVANINMDLFSKIMKVNFFSSVQISKSLLPLMVKKGSGAFIVTSSLSGKYGVPKLSAYSASKHALHGYFESLRAEYTHAGIQVTMVVPGLVKTNISVNAIRGDGQPYGKMQKAISS
jgi:short-subunit dehydrogenase